MSPLGVAVVLVSLLGIVAELPTLFVTGTSPSTDADATTSSQWEVDTIRGRRRGTRLPPNADDPDYIHSTSSGGQVGRSGNDGAVVVIAKLPAVGMSIPLELRAHYFAREEDVVIEKGEDVEISVVASSNLTSTTTTNKKKVMAYQEYIVPGNGRRGPYVREVTVKVWGAGGGGCNGGE